MSYTRPRLETQNLTKHLTKGIAKSLRSKLKTHTRGVETAFKHVESIHSPDGRRGAVYAAKYQMKLRILNLKFKLRVISPSNNMNTCPHWHHSIG